MKVKHTKLKIGDQTSFTLLSNFVAQLLHNLFIGDQTSFTLLSNFAL